MSAEELEEFFRKHRPMPTLGEIWCGCEEGIVHTPQHLAREFTKKQGELTCR